MSKTSFSSPPKSKRPASWFTRPVCVFALIRPHLLVPAWVCALSGAAGSADSWQNWPFTLTVFFNWSLALAAIHLVNLLGDQEGDILNRKNLFWRDVISERAVARFAVCFGFVACMGTAVLALVPELSPDPHSGPRAASLIAATLLLGLTYSLPPTYLSRRWGWDLAANILGYAVIAPGLGFLMVRGFAATTFADGIESLAATICCLGFLVAAAFLWTVVLDQRGDRQTGKTSWAIRWGSTTSCRLALCLSLAAPLAARQAGHPLWSLACAPVSIFALLICRRCDNRRLLTVGIFLATAVAALPGLMRWPQAAAPIIIWLLASYLAYAHLRPEAEASG